MAENRDNDGFPLGSERDLRPVREAFSDGRCPRPDCKEPIPSNAIEGDKCQECLFPLRAADGDRDATGHPTD